MEIRFLSQIENGISFSSALEKKGWMKLECVTATDPWNKLDRLIKVTATDPWNTLDRFIVDK